MISFARLMRIMYRTRTALIVGFIAIPALIAYFSFLIYLTLFHELPKENLSKAFVGTNVLFAALYGFGRALCFHPAIDIEYHDWLAQSPWTPSHPLPKGPLHPVSADILFLATLGILNFLATLLHDYSTPIWLISLVPFLTSAFVVSLIWSFLNFHLDQEKYGFAALSLPVLFGLCGASLVTFSLCPVLMFGIGWLGIRRSLHNIPWNLTPMTKREKSVPTLGWPYQELLDPPDPWPYPLQKAVATSLLAGGWAWLLAELMHRSDPSEDSTVFLIFLWLVSFLLLISRSEHYSKTTCSRFCLGTRLANKTWIIPKHDMIFLAHFLIIVCGTILPGVLSFYLPVRICCGVSTFTMVLISMGMGPSATDLYYTGVHSKFGHLSPLNKEFTTPDGSRS